jgi:hypothetical protein
MQHSSTPLSSKQILAVLVLITAVLSVVNEEVVEFCIQIAKFKLKAAMVKVMGGVLV